MNDKRRKKLDGIAQRADVNLRTLLESLSEELDAVHREEVNAYNNLPEPVEDRSRRDEMQAGLYLIAEAKRLLDSWASHVDELAYLITTATGVNGYAQRRPTPKNPHPHPERRRSTMPAAHIPSVSTEDDLQAFTKPEVMARLKCSERHVDRLIDAGKLQPIGRRARGVTVRITARSLREYIYGPVSAGEPV